MYVTCISRVQCVYCDTGMCRFKNAVPVSFDDAGRHAEQEFDLQHDKDGVMEYQTK